jgi:hypothetical protein
LGAYGDWLKIRDEDEPEAVPAVPVEGFACSRGSRRHTDTAADPAKPESALRRF